MARIRKFLIFKNTYPIKGWQCPVNNFRAWLIFHMAGFYIPANDKEQL